MNFTGQELRINATSYLLAQNCYYLLDTPQGKDTLDDLTVND